MPRIAHGASLTLERVDAANRELTDAVRAVTDRLALPIAIPGAEALGPTLPTLPFPFIQVKNTGYLFPDLQTDPGNLLPESPATVKALEELAASMDDADPNAPRDSAIPAVYTYFGQFIDHDVTFDVQSGDLTLDANRKPLPESEVPENIKNLRTAPLDLDSVYGAGAARVGDKFVLGSVSAVGPRPDGTATFGDDVDLPREPPKPSDPVHDKAALLGDPRNDENLFISQMHVAFLRAHNALIAQGMSFAKAKRTLVQHYQWLVLHDFLPRIADPGVVHHTLVENSWYKPTLANVYMPLEFSAAAFRFGHSMVRARYDYNSVFPAATLAQLFTFTALSGNFAGLPTLPQNWIADWRRMVDGPMLNNLARRIDTHIINPLKNLEPDPENTPPNPVLPPLRAARARNLPERNLVRGYRLRLPTGQAVAKRLGVAPLTPAQLAAAVPAAQAAVLAATGLDKRTPLWFYVLAEAAHGGGGRLGFVGSTLVAETLVGLARRSSSSILSSAGWKPTLGAGGNFTFADLFRLAKTIA